MAKILVVANLKGGVGKTSTLVHLGFDYFERNLRVCVIDLDIQANASHTLKKYDTGFKASQLFDSPNTNGENLRKILRGLPEGPVMSLIASDPALADMERRNLVDAAQTFKEHITVIKESNFDVILIDTAPALGINLAAALSSADYVLSPIEMETYSIQGIKMMITTIASIKGKVNDKLSFIGMMPSKVDGRNPRHKKHLTELIEAYPKLMTPVKIGLRSSVADAVASGVPVWQIKKTAARKAATEVRAVAKYVYDAMGMGVVQ
ncbi:MAG: ParA family protein [Methylococcales bacterium]|nr:ParA family protein [Methylococcales bacterium]